MASNNFIFLTLMLACAVVNTDAIQCYSCDNCADSGKLSSASECTKVEYPKGAKSFFEDAGLGSFMKDVKDTFNSLTGSVVKSCYKVVVKQGDNENVYRGCSLFEASAEPTCTTKGDHETCTYTCDKDGCNSAPAVHIPGAVIMTCLLLAFAFILA